MNLFAGVWNPFWRKLTGILIQTHVILNNGENVGGVGREGPSGESEVGRGEGDFFPVTKP